MSIRVLRSGVVAVVRGDQRDPGLCGHADKTLVDELLVVQPVILQLQEEVPLSEYIPVGQSCLFRVFIESLSNKPCHLTGKAGGGTDQPFVVLPEHFLIHPGSVIETFLKSR